MINAGLNEAVTWIEVIKATGQESQERGRFDRNARLYRRLHVAQGWFRRGICRRCSSP